MIRATLLYTVATFIPRLAGLMVVPLYTKVLSPSEYGVLASIEALKAILGIVITMGLERGMYRLYYDYEGEERRRYMGSLFLSVAGVSVVISVLLNTVFAFLVQQLFPSIDFYPYLVLGIFTSLVAAVGAVPSGYLRLAEKAGIYMVTAVLRTIATVAVAATLLLSLRLGVLGVLFANLAVEFLFLAVTFLLAVRNFTFAFDWSMTRVSLAFSIPMLPNLLASWVINQSNRVFIDRYLSQADLGIFSLASKASEAGAMLAVAFMTAYQPIYYRSVADQGEDGARPTLKKYNTLFILLVAASLFVVAFFSRELVLLLADRRYAGAQKLIPFMAAFVFIAQITGLNNLALYQRKKTVQVMLSVVASSLVALALNWLLIPQWGLLGAVLAAIGSGLLNYVITLVQSRRAYFVGFHTKAVLLVIGAMVAFVLLGLFLDSLTLGTALALKLPLLTVSVLTLAYLYRKQIRLLVAMMHR